MKKAHLDKERLKRFKSNPGFQEKFLISNKKNRLITVGNQAGKSTIGAVESAYYALGEHPHKKIRVPNTGIIVTGQGFNTGIQQIIVPKLKQVVGSGDILRIKNNSQGVPIMIEWRSGSITHLMSSEQDDDVFEGTTVDWAWIDEPVRRNIYVALKRGMLTTGGHLWMTCTPLDEPWIFEEFYTPGVNGSDPEIEVFEGTPDQNVYITQEEKDEFRSRLTEDEMEARWYGKFRHLTGRVFKEYRPDRHRIPAFDIPSHWPVYCAIDPHRNKPQTAVFLAVSPQNKFYICNEIYVKCPILKLADYILDVSAQYSMVMHLIDTSAQESGWEKESARQILQRAGVRTRLAQKKNLKASGITLINQLFASDELFVMEHCRRVHRELTNQVFKRNKRDGQQVLEEPEKKFDETTDCIRYILVERPRYRGRAEHKEIGPIYVREESI